MDAPPVVCLLGPTAAGKTALALALCEHYPFEIVSVDSALVYRGMDIGTAKPGPEELARVPHHLIDIRDPAQSYSAGEFRTDALRLIGDIRTRGRIPLLVGGTMLYFKILRDGIAELPVSDADVRAGLEARGRSEGWPALHAELARVDPVSAARLHPNHSQRIQRALEVFMLSGSPLSELQRSGAAGGPALLGLAVLPARALLHERIAARFRQMLDTGLIDEVAQLRARGDLHTDLPSMRAVGYRQVWAYLDGEVTREVMLEQGIAATRQLAKRQFTWLRKWPDLLPIDAGDSAADGTAMVREALKYLRRTPI